MKLTTLKRAVVRATRRVGGGYSVQGQFYVRLLTWLSYFIDFLLFIVIYNLLTVFCSLEMML